MAFVEYSIPTEGEALSQITQKALNQSDILAGVKFYPGGVTSISQIYLLALSEIHALFNAILKHVVEPESVEADHSIGCGRKFGCRMSLYSIGSFRLQSAYGYSFYLVRILFLLPSCILTDRLLLI
jgi:hypothetical protein